LPAHGLPLFGTKDSSRTSESQSLAPCPTRWRHQRKTLGRSAIRCRTSGDELSHSCPRRSGGPGRALIRLHENRAPRPPVARLRRPRAPALRGGVCSAHPNR
jgi:hypothetical protein